MSFYISHHGEVERVFYEEDEHPMILALKKVLLSTLSSRLIVSQQALDEQRRWAYQAQEVGHEGMYHSTGRAEEVGILGAGGGA